MAKVFSDIAVSQLRQMYRWWIVNKTNLVNNSRRRGIGGGGSEIRRAFVKGTPGATIDVVCYLDEDNSNTEVTVTIKIHAGGGFLNGALPLLTDGEDFLAWYDDKTSTWRNVTTFFKTGIC